MKNEEIMDYKAAIGGRVRKLRQNAGHSQQELADAILVKKTAISRKEAGKNYFNPGELAQISGVYGVSLDFLILGRPVDVISCVEGTAAEARLLSYFRSLENGDKIELTLLAADFALAPKNTK